MSAGGRRIAIATACEVGDHDVDAPALLAALADRGVAAETQVWDDPAVDWLAYDLVIVRSTWDYPRRRDAFVAWVEELPRVLNSAAVLRWNTDKRYLADLAAAGVPTVPTTFVGPGDEAALPALPEWDEFVIKPTVSVGSADTARWRRGCDDADALGHLRALVDAGRTAMLQPYLSAVDVSGESALLYLGGTFSHSALKGPLLAAGARPIPLEIGGDYDAREQISPRTATAAELAVADRALAAVPGGASELLYARVDLLPDADGQPVVLELELTEPSLFLWTAPGSAERLADAVVQALG
jgi:glutathione synthase/RimK-type ligase-like ATP-grasp enzyme